MQLWNEYSLMLVLCSRCGKVVILNVFKTGINGVSLLPVFMLCSFFPTPSGDSSTRVPRAEPESSITIYIGERELALYICATTHGPISLSC